MTRKTALITGASRGLGKELARVFAKNGYDLLLHCKDSNLPEFEGVSVSSVKGDLRLAHVIAMLIQAAKQRNVSVLINNAAVYVSKPFNSIEYHEMHEVLDVNLISPMFLTKGIWQTLSENGGVVVNINSVAGKVGGAFESLYCASKHGLRGFSSALQFDATKDDVSVISVFLGAMKTEMSASRPEWEKFIDPAEGAEIIYQLCEERKTLRVTEIDLARRNY